MLYFIETQLSNLENELSSITSKIRMLRFAFSLSGNYFNE